MMGIVLIVLVVLLGLALIWKPSRTASPSKPNALQSAIQSMAATPAPVARFDPLDDEIGIIAEAIREADHKRRKAAAMDKLRAMLEE